MKYKAFCMPLGTAGAYIAHKFTIAVGKGIHLRFLDSAAMLPKGGSMAADSIGLIFRTYAVPHVNVF